MRLTRTGLALAALVTLALLAPSASAHPVVLRCTGPLVAESADDYLGQLDPTDPNTWISGIVYVNHQLGCGVDCAFLNRCYPMPCFYDPDEGPVHCDQAHPIEVPWPV